MEMLVFIVLKIYILKFFNVVEGLVYMLFFCYWDGEINFLCGVMLVIIGI